jgi:MFS transporter, PAT family, solute carrier family 33 (acetyl-CoA transportor), member 1
VFALWVFYTPQMREDDGRSFPIYYYVAFFLMNLITSSITFVTFVAIGSFYAQISDKAIGGTYMTFLALWSNLGKLLINQFIIYYL